MPLLMYDFSNEAKPVASVGTEGMIFSDIKISDLKTDVLGDVDVKAMVRNRYE